MIRTASTGSRARLGSVRTVLFVVTSGIALIGGAVAIIPSGGHVPAPIATPLAYRLDALSYGFAVPISWFAAPIPGLRDGDVLDLLGTRPGERATAQDVASGLRVMSADDRTLVVELRADDAAAIAAAHARGLALIPIVRSAR